MIAHALAPFLLQDVAAPHKKKRQCPLFKHCLLIISLYYTIERDTPSIIDIPRAIHIFLIHPPDVVVGIAHHRDHPDMPGDNAGGF